MNLRARSLEDRPDVVMFVDHTIFKGAWNMNWSRPHWAVDAPSGVNAGMVDGSVRFRALEEMELQYTYNPGLRDFYW
jgi:prepilin-type processing-associated H-X9-DG protein